MGHQPLAPTRELRGYIRGQFGDLAKVRARRENPIAAREYDKIDCPISLDGSDDLLQTGQRLTRQRIANLGPVECDDDRSV
jgi:hypothetical protein